MASLRRVKLSGFKSIKEMDLELRPLNVLIGANGAGKSNLISFFNMLNEMMAGRLQTHIATSGHAHSLLYFGPKVTRQIRSRLEFSEEDRLVDLVRFDEAAFATYEMSLTHAATDRLIFSEERMLGSAYRGDSSSSTEYDCGSGHLETEIDNAADKSPVLKDRSSRVFRRLLEQCRVFHFHDTSPTARLRQYCYVDDNRRLLADGGNLAALLLRFKDENKPAYQRIVSTIQLVAPFFDEFDLEERRGGSGNGPDITLNWRDRGSDEVFGPHQLSDGTLRAMCLITLLMQPEDQLPDLIIVDEPELGLHPYAVNVIASLFKKASHHTQVLVSTQSTSFLDHFDPEDVIVVNREGRESQFTRPDPEQLESWLEDYSFGEVWEKNIIGGGPH